ncbi:hypothetical protein Thena_0363 [Thermodesulfobium narugense DSM 14796]|uniref:DUF948 domain-containing protein n=1 Tax=Thermodesulfobium narugense DSM 14796 TaxID=747365 RepID=M1E7I9_9BACT|nr:hypothetical protein [Thermodesulfobium narugense]AEE14009.1 hypothetical protein Thena_0363 [Thermodesulfobium narugense DSM 14796]
MSLFEFLIFVLAAILVGLIGWWIYNVVGLIKELKKSVVTLDQVLVETRDTIGSFRKFSDDMYPEIKKSMECLSDNSVSILKKIDNIIGVFSDSLNASRRFMEELNRYKLKISLLTKIIDAVFSRNRPSEPDKKRSRVRKAASLVGDLLKKFV